MVRREFVLTLLAVPAVAQEPSPPPLSQPAPSPSSQQPIRVQVNEVIVPITVTDDKGRVVTDIRANDLYTNELMQGQ